MEFHPVANLFPMMTAEEFDSLVEDIKANGLKEPIWTHEGKIIDGRNRYRACEKAGFTPSFRVWDGKGSLVQFVVSLNLKRRHLTSSQKAMVAVDILPMLEEEARKRQMATLRQNVSDSPILDERNRGRSDSQAAAVVGVARGYVAEAKSITHRAPEVAEKVREGKITLPEAKKVAKLSEEDRAAVIRAIHQGDKVQDSIKQVKQQKQQEAIAALPEPQPQPGLFSLNTIQQCSIHELEFPSESVDMVFTDPPYHDEHVELYGRLAELAAKCVKPGGYVLCYAGKMFLPQIIASMSLHLEYVSLLAVFQPFSKAKIVKHAIFENWRPILAFKRPGKTETKEWVQDVVRGTRDKEFHEWQQDSEAPLQYIAAYTKPGDIVLDPFVGGGTTPWACKRLGRYYLAYDVDIDAVKVATERVNHG